MNRMIGGLMMMGAWLPAIANGGAPFCVMSSGPPQCFYYDVQSCQSAARTMQGLCSANPLPMQRQLGQQSSTPTPQRQPFNVLDGMRHVQQAGEQGARLGMERREHEARMRLLQDQIDANQHSQPRKIEHNGTIGYWVLYECRLPDGTVQFTGEPAIGCVVTQVTAY